VQPVLGPLLFGLFMVFVYMIIVNFFVSLVTECYEAVREALLKEEEQATARGGNVDAFGYIVDLLKSYLRIGQKEKLETNEELRFAYIAGAVHLSSSPFIRY